MHTKTKFCMQKIFFEKCLFAYEIRFAVENKNKKFWAKFSKLLKKFLCRHQKNASHTISIYRNCMISIFGAWRSTRAMCAYFSSELGKFGNFQTPRTLQKIIGGEISF